MVLPGHGLHTQSAVVHAVPLRQGHRDPVTKPLQLLTRRGRRAGEGHGVIQLSLNEAPIPHCWNRLHCHSCRKEGEESCQSES